MEEDTIVKYTKLDMLKGFHNTWLEKIVEGEILLNFKKTQKLKDVDAVKENEEIKKTEEFVKMGYKRLKVITRMMRDINDVAKG